MPVFELSCDLGEASDERWLAVERELWTLIDAANVACGGHAGDETSMREAARLASQHGIILAAHPSYPDRENFGRKSLWMKPRELRLTLIHQMSTFAAIAAKEGVVLQRVKAHGALYNDAHRDRALAEVLVDAMKAIDESLSIVAGNTSEMAVVAREAGIDVVREAFADRRYTPEGTLVSRKEAGALLSIEEAAEQAHRLATRHEVVARGGAIVPIEFDTICIHADTPQAVERARAIRARLTS
jgi:5-oxoprolinase (ATP-hydrolysing) subunit A